ncbi:MAG: poly(A) polymerase [Coxiella sp. (in: Bacteria)]|nr:MAG: poly(A) polymerase [Coxiella sp. (in: g-proteobacteria)]
MWKRLKRRFSGKGRGDAVVIGRHEHKVSRKFISPNAIKVLYRLNKAGYSAFLVGGSVRDVLLQRKPKDFDVATDAHPEDIRKVFRNCRLIGRRFRLAHVYFHDEVIEVSTFRANVSQQNDIVDGEMPVMVKSDNTYGTIEEDAWRRDFTVNALYYNIKNFSVSDYTGGMLDLKQRLIRMIGDPNQRYHEDPVRLLRAIRLSAKLGFTVEEKTEEPLFKLSNLLWHVAPARLFDEILKLFFEGNAVVTYKSLLHYGYMRVLFPITFDAITHRDNTLDTQLIKLAMKATDDRFAIGKSLNPGFLMAILLWPAVQDQLTKEEELHHHFHQALHAAIDNVLLKQVETVSIPKRMTAMMRAIWLLQYHLIRRRGKRVYRTLSHRYFRAAYDFLELRAKSGEDYQGEVDWWHQFQTTDTEGRAHLIDTLIAESKQK